MAELFSLATGVVGFASLGIQLLDSAKKLKELCRAYGVADEEINTLVSELEILGRLESRFSQREAPQTGQVQDVIGTSWIRLHATRLSLQAIVKSIQGKLAAKPRRGQIQYVFSESNIRSWLEKLGRAKVDLSLALQLVDGYDLPSPFDCVTDGR